MTVSHAGPVRVGVIGCGVIAYWVYLRVLQRMKHATLVSACDPQSVARERAARIARVPIVESAKEVLGDSSVDAVVICTPSHLHAGLAIGALDGGKHVFVEKPVATNTHDARCVIEAAERSGLVAMVGFNRRFHPLIEQARTLVMNGDIGRVIHIQSAFCEPMAAEELSKWRRHRETGGGVLLDLGSHHIDLIRWLLNDEVNHIECSLSSQATEHDTASLSLSMRNGTTVQSFFSYRAGRADFLEIIGERGTLRVDRHQPKLFMRRSRRFGYGTRGEFVFPDATAAKFRAKRIVRPSADPSYARALSAFVDSIRGEQHQTASLDDGARALDVVLAAEHSARSGSRIHLEA